MFDLDDLDALKVEHDENEQCKEPTVSERVALAEAIAERLQGRRLANLVQNRSGNISCSEEQGKTRDLAAAKAGLGSGKTLEAAPLHKGWIPNPTLSDFSSGWAVMAGFQI